MRLHALAMAALLATPVAASAQDSFTCAAAPEPVMSLAYGSRYAEGDASRSELDTTADAEADDALRPIDDFLRDLTETANTVLDEGTDKAAVADCLVGQMAAWARADAMGDLQSPTSNLTIGARIAGFGLVLLQVQDHSRMEAEKAEITGWLQRLMQAQLVFWEEEAPDGARQGNLRAWAALAASTTAALTDDAVMRGWAAWSVSYILCKAEADGSLPQEMSRGKYALKYQLHSIAPMAVSVLLLDRQGIALQGSCSNALARIVGFAVEDLAEGRITAQITGKTQSFFDGTDELEGFHLAWLEAYLLLEPEGASALNQLAETYRPLNFSKLGGNQTLLWQALR
ncbi:alginate lyase family protein [Fertoebacter nigrum]|uniref:Alginate lyase family protein n=1 Tax=Fertoeibacter niger TaxID=2656921 RepID=A0A8X8H0H1_9RHOB|nr:alginate lyase family protein [Fertoeibacter niger]NUB44846.1 alginate lyase family protein [Fertoeibacter niger]